MRHPKSKRSARRRDLPYGRRVPKALYQAIETERDSLAQAESVLGCLVAALAQDPGDERHAHYPDVAQIAKDLIRRSINRLDALEIEKLLRRDRVEDMIVGARMAWVGASLSCR